MKVVHLTSVHPVFDARIFHRECRSLVQLGYEVVLIAPHCRDETVEGVQIRAVCPRRGRFLRMTVIAFAIYRRSILENADIYHFHDPELIPAGLLLRMRGRQVIYDIHEDLPKTIESKSYLPAWCRRPLKWLAKYVEELACRWFSALVTATPTIALRFPGARPKATIVCNYPVLEDPVPSQPGWGNRRQSVAYIGSITRERGIWEVVQAMNLLPPTSPIRLTLAGRFWSEALYAQVTQLPGWNRVDYIGVIHPKEIPLLLSSVRAGIVVLHPLTNYLSSMPIKLFEYMAAGIPVVASDFPLWREIVGEAKCGLLVDPGRPSAIAEAIQLLVNCPEEAEAMGSRGRRATECSYNWQSQQRQLQAVYMGLCHDDNRASARQMGVGE